MAKTYDYAVVIGRFQPFHNAHKKLIKHASSIADSVIILLGSHKTAPDVRNPFTSEEREKIIKDALPIERNNLVFKYIRDYPYNDNVWVADVQNKVYSVANRDSKIALVGHYKDDSSYYLNLFPQWKQEPFGNITVLDSTSIRDKLFKGDDSWKDDVPAAAHSNIEKFLDGEIFTNLKHEYDYITEYKKNTTFVGVPYQPIFLTTDAVIIQSGHILLVRRGINPGKGLLALPGGFLEPNLTLEESALKEVMEETNIKLPKAELRKNIKVTRNFDWVPRSQRGRTVTVGFLIDLPPRRDGLPSVEGGDDASEAFWMPLSDMPDVEDLFMEDHFHMIRFFLGLGIVSD